MSVSVSWPVAEAEAQAITEFATRATGMVEAAELIHATPGPLIVSGTWLRRTTIIGTNNALVCVVVVLIGPLGHLAWLGVAMLGLGLGTALRLMSVDPPPDDDEAEPTSAIAAGGAGDRGP